MKKILSIFLAVTGSFALLAADVPTIGEGYKQLSAKKNAEAETIFRAVIQNGSAEDNYNATIGLMYSLRYQKKNDDVVKEVDAWVAKNPDATVLQKAHLCIFKGNALRDTGKIDDALAAYKTGVEYKTTNSYSTDCAKEYINVAIGAGKKDLAQAMYDATKDEPVAQKNPGYLLNAAMYCWKANKGEEGIKMLEKAEQLKSPDWVKENLYRVRGYLYRDCLEKYEDAVKAFEQALALPGLTGVQKAVLWNNIGSAYEKDEEYEKAVEAYKKVGTFNAQGWFIKSAENSAKRLQKKIDAGE